MNEFSDASESIVKECCDCHQEFELRAGEIQFYEQMRSRVPGFVLPKRCKVCREQKRVARTF